MSSALPIGKLENFRNTLDLSMAVFFLMTSCELFSDYSRTANKRTFPVMGTVYPGNPNWILLYVIMFCWEVVVQCTQQHHPRPVFAAATDHDLLGNHFLWIWYVLRAAHGSFGQKYLTLTLTFREASCTYTFFRGGQDILDEGNLSFAEIPNDLYWTDGLNNR